MVQATECPIAIAGGLFYRGMRGTQGRGRMRGRYERDEGEDEGEDERKV